MTHTNMHAIFEQQQLFFKTGKTLQNSFRLAQLKKLKKILLAHEQDILDVLHADLGKSSYEAFISEFYLILSEIQYAIKHLEEWSARQAVPTSITLFPAQSYIVPQPYGVVLITSAWNYPLQLLLIPLVGALAAGNCVFLKPSEYAPHTAAFIKKILSEHFDSAYIAVVDGNAQLSEQLVALPFNYIFFTGSSIIGKKVMAAAAEHLTPLTLELGGKTPCILMDDANIACAAKRIAWGKFLNAGQNCVSPDYLLVQQSVKEKFIHALIQQIEKLYPNKYAIGRIINEKHFDRICTYLSQGNIRYGGTTDKSKLFIEPTIMDTVSLDGTIMQDEIFGPILPIISFDTLEQALQIINTQSKPVALYIFSSDKKIQDYIERHTHSGTMAINDLVIQASSLYLPFGGIGGSGFGSYHGKKTFETFSHYKSVLVNKCWLDLPFRYPPFNLLHKIVRKILRKSVS